jgi:hypothetical protein
MSIAKRLAAALAAAAAAFAADPGTYTVYGAAVLASLGTLYELALNYAGWNAGTALLFAVTIDIYWLKALHMAMSNLLSRKRRTGAALHAFAAIAVSVACNILYHELHAGNWHLSHTSGALVTAAMASVPLLAAAALTHLRYLSRAKRDGTERSSAEPSQDESATAPAQPPQATAPAEPPQATAPAEPPRRTAPDRPGQPPQDKPPQGGDVTAPAADEPGGETGDDLPRPLKAGGRPDPIAVAKAREIYTARLRDGQLMGRRALQSAVNEHYGFPVIGETSADSVITEHRSKRTA